MTHCQREFVHAQWKEILDDDFLEAYEHGVVIECCDGKKRRFYLRIFSYTADYPEKYVMLYLIISITNKFIVAELFLVVSEAWVTVHVPGVLFQKTVPISWQPNVINISEKVWLE